MANRSLLVGTKVKPIASREAEARATIKMAIEQASREAKNGYGVVLMTRIMPMNEHVKRRSVKRLLQGAY